MSSTASESGLLELLRVAPLLRNGYFFPVLTYTYILDTSVCNFLSVEFV